MDYFKNTWSLCRKQIDLLEGKRKTVETMWFFLTVLTTNADDVTYTILTVQLF
jgi:hypothetical protein